MMRDPNAPAANSHKALFGIFIFTLSVHTSSFSFRKGRQTVATVTVRLNAMSANIVQAATQGQPLLLFTQHLPIIRLWEAGFPSFFFFKY